MTRNPEKESLTEMIIPITEGQQMLLENGDNGNFSLYFRRMCKWDIKKGIKKPVDGVTALLCHGNNCIKTAGKYLGFIHDRQRQVLKYYNYFSVEITARLTSPFISGLGAGHPYETGLILDRNTGIPYIPATGIKGVMRLAHALNLAEKDKNVKKGIISKGVFKKDQNGHEWNVDDAAATLQKYFGFMQDKDGEESVRGQLVFLDAFPEELPVLKLDIMNPHYRTYYSHGEKKGNPGPIETENPNPIKFISVEPGCCFVFRAFVLPLSEPKDLKRNLPERTFNEKDRDNVIEMFATAFERIGLGGKTSIGYGRFGIEVNKYNGQVIEPRKTVLVGKAVLKHSIPQSRGKTTATDKKVINTKKTDTRDIWKKNWQGKSAGYKQKSDHEIKKLLNKFTRQNRAK